MTDEQQPGWGMPPPPIPPPGRAAPQVPPGLPPDHQRLSAGQAQPYPTPAPQLGPIPLRPMTLGDILDGGFKVFRASWQAVLVIAAIVAVPAELVRAYFQRDLLTFQVWLQPMPLDEPVSSAGDAVAYGLWLLALPLLWGALCKVAAEALVGRTITWSRALSVALRRLHWLYAAWFVILLVGVLPFGIAVGVLAAGAAGQNIGLLLLGMLLMLAGLVAMAFVLAVFIGTAPAMMAEAIGPWRALRRSVRLLGRRALPVFGTVLLLGLITSLINLALTAIPAVVAVVLAETVGQTFGWILVGIAGAAGQVVTLPYLAITAVLLYADARIRQEGMDLALAAAASSAS